MIQTIRVLNTFKDSLGLHLLNEIKNLGFKNIKDVQTARIYRVEGITEKDAKILSEKLFCEKINQCFTINSPIVNGNCLTLEIAYKPGVMNPEVGSVLKASKDLNINILSADSSSEFYFFGKVKKEELIKIIEKLNLYNKTVEHVVNEEPQTLLIQGSLGPTNTIPIKTMNDEKLMALSKDKLFLNLEEMKIIQKYFQKIDRDPKDLELETLAQTWSEHCAHKTFKANLIVDGKKKEPLISRIKKEALKHKKNIVSAFVDNSGVMSFYNNLAICGKVETHNSPSAIEPYGGAMTGSGGVFRDVLGTGQGAKTIASTDIFCFAEPEMPVSKLPKGCLPPDYLLKKIVFGVRDYGNRMGIPTNNGSVHFHNDFRAKPTVIVGAYGLIPKKFAQKGKPKKGDLVVAVGGKTGRDGIHGATFSSGEMTEKTINVNSSAVQIGNAIEEKRMFDAIIEARDQNLIHAIQDCGAGGFSSAIGEMGENLGVTIDLSKAPLKYQGLSPWEIWISESQERMILAIPKKRVNKFLKICKKYNVEASVLGTFGEKNKNLKIYYQKNLVCDLDMKFIHNGLPQRKMIAKKPTNNKLETITLEAPKTEKEWINAFEKVLSHGNVSSKEPIVRMYDHSVQGSNSLQPFSGLSLDGPMDSVVLKPILDKQYGIIISHGLNPVLNNIDPYYGSIWAGVEALSNYVAVGGNYKEASLINNYIWPFPDEESLYSLDKSVDAVVDLMKTLKIPVISGKDSLSSTYRGKDGLVIKIPPVLCISAFGKIKDVSKTISSDFKKENSLVLLVGKLDKNLGGSIYFDINKVLGDEVPKIDLKILPKVFNAIYKGIQKGKILSCHDVSEGGIITSIFEMCVGGDMGAEVTLSNLRSNTSISSISKIRPDFFLFNETAGSFIIEVENEKEAKRLFRNIPYTILGKTIKEKTINVSQNKKTLFKTSLDHLKNVWKMPMERIFQ